MSFITIVMYGITMSVVLQLSKPHLNSQLSIFFSFGFSFGSASLVANIHLEDSFPLLLRISLSCHQCPWEVHCSHFSM